MSSDAAVFWRKLKAESYAAQAAREDEGHTHCFEKTIRCEGLWLILECSIIGCPSRIQYMVVR